MQEKKVSEQSHFKYKFIGKRLLHSIYQLTKTRIMIIRMSPKCLPISLTQLRKESVIMEDKSIKITQTKAQIFKREKI